MQSHMKLGDFLIAYLEKIGVSHMFGIPGDLVINLFFKFGRHRGLKIVTFSHEPGVGFAADGYARAKGRIGVICVTYGAGAQYGEPRRRVLRRAGPAARQQRRPRRRRTTSSTKRCAKPSSA